MQERTAVYASGGALAAIVLGMALSPLREATTACSLAFGFVALVVVVAELGGRTAAVVTALASALSLDFFLTEPYLTLSIAKRDDVIAFFGLALCGLVAAAFGSRREAEAEAGQRMREHLDLVREALRQLEGPAPRLDRLLGEACDRLGVAAVLRDATGRVLAACPADSTARPQPRRRLDPERLAELTPDGGRLQLGAGSASASLDLWNDGRGLAAWQTRALSDLARVFAVMGRRPLEAP
jgi:hypothetical protein